MPENIVRCLSCGINLDKSYANERINDVCPKCGSIYKEIELSLHEDVLVSESSQINGKEDKVKKPIIEYRVGDEFSIKLTKMVFKKRVIDRKNNNYFEEVVDKETGKIIHYCDEKLENHYGHGSAKNKK